jgi:hypothetical protein
MSRRGHAYQARLDGNSNPVFQGGADLSLQTAAPPVRVREHDRTRPGRRDVRFCQVGLCHAHARRRVEIELPAAWEGSPTYTVLTVAVGACDEHAPELERRVAAMLQARTDLHSLLLIVEAAVRLEADLRQQLAALQPPPGVDGGGQR